MQLAHDHALGPIDDKAALRGDERHLAHEHFFLLGAFLILEPEDDVERRAIGLALVDALEPVHLGRAYLVVAVLEHDFFVVARNGEDFVEHRLQADVLTFSGAELRLEELVIRVHLNFNQVGRRNDFLDSAEVDAAVRFVRHRLCRGLSGPVGYRGIHEHTKTGNTLPHPCGGVFTLNKQSVLKTV